MSLENADHTLNFSLRVTQALELGIHVSDADTMESLEIKIAAKLHDGMEQIKDIVEQIELTDYEPQ